MKAMRAKMRKATLVLCRSPSALEPLSSAAAAQTHAANSIIYITKN